MPVRVSICHCLACQRRTGSAFGYQVRFRWADAEISGESREYVRPADDDGEGRSHRFCPNCGATVYYTNAASPELIAIPVGAFADPSFPAPDFSVWERRMYAWMHAPAEAEHVW